VVRFPAYGNIEAVQRRFSYHVGGALTAEDLLKHLGPLAPLAGIWEGEKGDDTAPSDARGVERNRYRERVTFEPIGPVHNHEQCLYGSAMP